VSLLSAYLFFIKYISVSILLTKVVSSNPVHGEVYSIQHYVIPFVSDLWQVGGFLHWGTPVSSTNKTDSNDITEILLIVALNTINLNLNFTICV
jgi:hypothetical protein